MEKIREAVLNLNGAVAVAAETELEDTVCVEVTQGSGEMLFYVTATAGSELILEGGNTVFAGKSKAFMVEEDGSALIRVEIGPHLIQDQTGSYLKVSGTSGIKGCAIELK